MTLFSIVHVKTDGFLDPPMRVTNKHAKKKRFYQDYWYFVVVVVVVQLLLKLQTYWICHLHVRENKWHIHCSQISVD